MVDAENPNELEPRAHEAKIDASRFLSAGTAMLIQAWRPVRNRIPLLAPYRKAEVHVVREGALGDVLMATPALRRVKELNPKCRVTFYTHFANLVRGLPFIDDVRPVDAAPTGKAILLRYENLVPVRRHIAGIFGEILGVDIRNNRPSCVLGFRVSRPLSPRIPRSAASLHHRQSQGRDLESEQELARSPLAGADRAA